MICEEKRQVIKSLTQKEIDKLIYAIQNKEDYSKNGVQLLKGDKKSYKTINEIRANLPYYKKSE